MAAANFKLAAGGKTLEKMDTGEIIDVMLQSAARVNEHDLAGFTSKLASGKLTDDDRTAIVEFLNEQPDKKVVACLSEIERRCEVSNLTWGIPRVPDVMEAAYKLNEHGRQNGFVVAVLLKHLAPQLMPGATTPQTPRRGSDPTIK